MRVRPRSSLKKSLVVVRAVDRVVVEQAGNSAEADQAETAIGYGAGRAECEGGPAAAVDGEIVDRGVVDVSAEVGAIGGDDGEFRGGHDRFGESLDTEGDIDGRDAADFHGDAGSFVRAEAGDGNLKRIQAGLEMNEKVAATAVRDTARGAARAEIVTGHGGIGHHSA